MLTSGERCTLLLDDAPPEWRRLACELGAWVLDFWLMGISLRQASPRAHALARAVYCESMLGAGHNSRLLLEALDAKDRSPKGRERWT
jgi:hypothetical protein